MKILCCRSKHASELHTAVRGAQARTASSECTVRLSRPVGEHVPRAIPVARVDCESGGEACDQTLKKVPQVGHRRKKEQ